MQWRMLARRCPSGSMTLVGDFGQASRTGALASWDDVLAERHRAGAAAPRHALGELPHPGEIMEVANRLLPAAAPGVEPARSVRSTGAVPVVDTVGAEDLVAAAAAAGARRARRTAARWR